jgi:hypothetical protein
MRGTGLIVVAGLLATPAAAQSGANPPAMEKATPPEMAKVVIETGAEVPLPRARPPVSAKTAATAGPAKPAPPAGPPTFKEIIASLGLDPATVTSKPTLCDERLETMAKIALEPRLIGPGACGGRDLVQVDAVLLPGKAAVRLHPAPMLQCRMAESLAAWLRDEVAPRLAKLGSPLREVENWDAYECRSRNRVAGAKLSEHAKGDAIDLRSFRLADGRTVTLTDPRVDVSLREALRDTACARFTTVLGPGAPYHGEHIHLDALQRHNGYRICHWDVREPPPPLPRPKPAEIANAKPGPLEPAQSGPARREAAPSAKTEASRTAPARPKEAEPRKDANTVVAMVPAGAGAAQREILHIKPRPGTAAAQPDAAAVDTGGGVMVPLPAPKPASLAKAAPARKTIRVRHRRHRKRRSHFHFPFTLWR